MVLLIKSEVKVILVVVLAVASFALGFLYIFAFGDLATVVPLGHQVWHFEDHGSVIRLFSLPPAAFSLPCKGLRVLVVVHLGVVHWVVVVLGVQLRYGLKLWALIRDSILVRALVRVGTWYRVARVDVIEGHVTLLLLLGMRYCSVHCFDGQLGVELSAWQRCLWTLHQVVRVYAALLIHYHLVSRAVSGDCRSLYSSNPMAPLHHLIEYFLLSWIGIGLILLADRSTSIPRIISNAKEVSSSIVSAIGLRLVVASSMCSSQASRGESLGVRGRWSLQRTHLLHVKARGLWWLARYRVVLESKLVGRMRWV